MLKENDLKKVTTKAVSEALKEYFSARGDYPLNNGQTLIVGFNVDGSATVKISEQPATVTPEKNTTAQRAALAKIALLALCKVNAETAQTVIREARGGETAPTKHPNVEAVKSALRADPESFGIGSIHRAGSVTVPVVSSRVTVTIKAPGETLADLEIAQRPPEPL